MQNGLEATAAQGTTILFSTHLMDHVAKLCSHAVIINQGRVSAQGSLQDLLAQSRAASLEDLFLQRTARPAPT